MIRIDRVTTRGGDKGETSLGDGTRVRKDAPRVIAIGEVDEANAAIGVLRLHMQGADSDALLARIQNELFDLGADLCVPGTPDDPRRFGGAPVARLEQEAEALREGQLPLTSFVLPGGSPGAAHAHLARTIARRAERAVVALAAEEAVGPNVLPYLNRLSDLLFILARALNDGGRADVLWRPRANG